MVWGALVGFGVLLCLASLSFPGDLSLSLHVGVVGFIGFQGC